MKTVMMLGVVCALAWPTGAARAESLRGKLANAVTTVGLSGGTAFDAMANTIADTAARTLPVPAASAGFTYRFNPTLEVFERTSETLGPVFLERPDTLGRSKFNLNVSFQYVNLNAFDGQSMGNLHASNPIVSRVVDGNGNLLGFTADSLRYDVTVHNYVTAISATYGLLDDLDVNLLVPLIATTLDVGVDAQQVAIAGTTGGFVPSAGPPLHGDSSGDKFGIGDVLLRFKYRLPDTGAFRWGLGFQMRLPFGDEDNFQGTGSFEVSPALFASWHPIKWLEPHANLAVDLRTDDVEHSQARWGIGVDADVIPRLGLSLGILGRDEFSREAPAGSTDFLHLTSSNTTQLEPLLGMNFDRKDFIDLSFGIRAVVWREVMVFVNGLYALNDQGLHNDTIIPTIGVEGTF